MLKLVESVGLASSCSDATMSFDALMTDVTMGTVCAIVALARRRDVHPQTASDQSQSRSVRSYIHTLLALSGAPRGEGGSFPLWEDVQKLYNICVLSLSWNFFVSHDKYIARLSSKEPR